MMNFFSAFTCTVPGHLSSKMSMWSSLGRLAQIVMIVGEELEVNSRHPAAPLFAFHEQYRLISIARGQILSYCKGRPKAKPLPPS
jgi:hypothetical protein